MFLFDVWGFIRLPKGSWHKIGTSGTGGLVKGLNTWRLWEGGLWIQEAFQRVKWWKSIYLNEYSVLEKVEVGWKGKNECNRLIGNIVGTVISGGWMWCTCQKTAEEPRRALRLNQGLGGNRPSSSSSWRPSPDSDNVSLTSDSKSLFKRRKDGRQAWWAYKYSGERKEDGDHLDKVG